jgi:integrase
MSTKTRKSNGQGHTYKVGNSWKTVITSKGRTVTATAKTQQESKRRAKEKVHQLPVANNGKVVGANKVTLGEYLLPWLDFHHKNAIASTTYRRYRGLAVRNIIPALGAMQLNKITKREISNLMTSMGSLNIGPRSQNQALALLSKCMQGAVDSGLILTNPAAGMAKTPEPKSQITPLTEAQVLELLDKYKSTFMSARLHIAFCGLRQGEALGLQWKDIDFVNGTIQVHQQVQAVDGVRKFVKLKTDSSVRKVVLSDTALAALHSHKSIVSRMRLAAGAKWKDLDLVFPNREGSFQQSKLDYQRWQDALASCGIAARSLHNARHTAGTLMYANEVGIETIRRVLGHSSVGLTSRTYVHNAEEPLRRAAESMDNVYKKKGGSAA